MESDCNKASDRLKSAIKKYEKSSGKKIYSELPESFRVTLGEKAFEKKIQRMQDDKLLTDTGLLYNVLKILGISFESLFSDNNKNDQISFYLNKINETLTDIRKEQEYNKSILEAINNKKQTRTSHIKKLDRVLSITYLLQYVFFKDTKQNYFSQPLYLPQSSKYLETINHFQERNRLEPVFKEIFIFCYIQYSLKTTGCIKLIYDYVNKNNNPDFENLLGEIGINYILLKGVLDYINSFYPNNPFADYDNAKCENVKTKIKGVIQELDKTIRFLYIKKEISSEIYAERESLYNLLYKTCNFVNDILSLHIETWMFYKNSEENISFGYNQTKQAKQPNERSYSKKLLLTKLNLPVQNELINYTQKSIGVFESIKNAI